MLKDILWLVLRLYLPPDLGDPKAVYRFQAAQSLSLVTLWFAAWIVGLWLIGKVPFVPQVAWAGQIDTVSGSVQKLDQDNKQIVTQLTDIQLLQIRSNIETQMKYLCQARQTGNQADLDNANNQLSTLADSYYKLSGRIFRYPSCDTVLVMTK